jgi:hypothetical protein
VFVLLPLKARAWKSRLEPAPEFVSLPPDRTSSAIAAHCRQRSIVFVDASPTLLRESAKGVLVYNPMIDGHPTAIGAALIAEAIAGALISSSP